MTQEQLKNLDFLQKTFVSAGFGDLYHAELEKGVREGKPTIDLNFVDFEVSGKERFSFRPTVVEKLDRPGFYLFTELTAIKSVEGSPDLKITANHYQYTGMTVQQTQAVLNGGVVRHSDGVDSKREPKMYFTGIDFSKPMQPGEEPKLLRVPAKDFDLLRLVSQQSIIGREAERSAVLENIQNGMEAKVTLRVLNENGPDTYPKAKMRLQLVENKETGKYDLALQVNDPNGKQMYLHRQEAKEQQVLNTGLKMRTAKKADELSGTTVQLTAGAQPRPGGRRNANAVH